MTSATGMQATDVLLRANGDFSAAKRGNRTAITSANVLNEQTSIDRSQTSSLSSRTAAVPVVGSNATMGDVGELDVRLETARDFVEVLSASHNMRVKHRDDRTKDKFTRH